MIGLATQVAGYVVTGKADTSLVTAFTTFIFVGLGFRKDRARKENGGNGIGRS